MVRPTRSRLKRAFRTMSGPRCTMRITEWPWFAPSWPFICRHAPIGRLQMNPRARSGWGWAESGERCGGLACRVVHTRPCNERSVRETGHLKYKGPGRGHGDFVLGTPSQRPCDSGERASNRASAAVVVILCFFEWLPPLGLLVGLMFGCQVVVRVACRSTANTVFCLRRKISS